VLAPFGPFPRELADSYPLTATVPERPDRAGQCAAADGVRALVEANPETVFTLAVETWPPDALDRLPDRVTVESLADVRTRDGAGST
jgi:7-cyano-7-deazaguanine tRNA-ribosyltransferase